MQSIREEGASSVEPDSLMGLDTESKMREIVESGTMSVTVKMLDSGVEVCTMSVTGRTGGDIVIGLSAGTVGGVEESTEGLLSESIGGGIEGKTVTGLRSVEE